MDTHCFLTQSTANRKIKELVELGVLQNVSGDQRHPLYELAKPIWHIPITYDSGRNSQKKHKNINILKKGTTQLLNFKDILYFCRKVDPNHNT